MSGETASHKKKVTFDDIARYTGFSKTTISRYFNKPETLTPKNQEIVAKALEELGYQENKVAQILAKGKTGYIGIIMPNLSLHYFSELLNQILHTYQNNGYKFLVFVSDGNPDTERGYIQELLSYKVEGLLMMSHCLTSLELSRLDIPVVSIEREDHYISSVNCDNYMGAVQAVSALAQFDCDMYIHINVPTATDTPAYQRQLGFIDFCKERHLNYDVFIRDMGPTHDTIVPAMTEIFKSIEEKYPDKRLGIFCSDDTRTAALLNLIVRKYRYLPDRYKLIGFDNSPVCLDAVVSLSTVGQQIDRIAYEAASLLVQQIQHRTEKPVHKVITPVLIRRESTDGDAFIASLQTKDAG